MKKILHTMLNFMALRNKSAQSLPSFHLSLKGLSKNFLLVIIFALPITGWAQAAAWNYSTQTGNLGTTYSWIDCSSGTSILTGDDSQASVAWPFNFTFYNNSYTTTHNLSVATNGFIRLDGVADGADYNGASTYHLTNNATGFGQIVAAAIYDGYVGNLPSSWVNYFVTGSAPNRILTIEYNNIEIDYNDELYADVQVSFYETTNRVVLKLGSDNIDAPGVDIGIHSGVNGYFNKWQEVQNGTNNTWIEYTPPVEVNATLGATFFYYGTLKNAFDKINDGTHKGVVTIKVNVSTVETVMASLNASGSGSSNYASVTIYPTSTGISISGSINAPVINLNGADNVTLDGRVNATGSTVDLDIVNSRNSASASCVRFINSAINNTIQFCQIKASETGSGSGAIVFSSSTSGNGNDNNLIDNNNITGDVTRLYNAIYSSGTAGRENSEVTISNNNFFDFINASSSSNGINIGTNSTNWTISGNSFYETTTIAPTAAYSYFMIYTVASTTGHLITGNYIGGSAPQCGGSAFTVNSSLTHYFYAMNINGGTTSPVMVQNNVIKNFNYTSKNANPWDGLYLASNKIDVTGNTIGATTGTGSIVVTAPGTTSYTTTHGIRHLSTGTVTISNNTIGSITTIGSNTYSHGFEAIIIGGAAPTISIINNLIGSSTTTNSIQTSSAAAASSFKQDLRGIYISSSIPASTITGNTIANLTNAYTGASVSKIDGICTSGGSNTIQNNTIYNLTTGSSSITVKGIQQTVVTAGTNQTVTGNTVYNLSNTHASASIVVMGIDYTGPTTGTNVVSGNFIHSLTISSTNVLSEIDGIRLSGGLVTCANNIINIGAGLSLGYKLYGIYENSGASVANVNNIYFNTVYIGGTVSSGTTSSTAALWNSNNTNIRNIRNNVFMNARSGGATGIHYAIRLGGTSGLTIDYNDYFATTGILGSLSGDKTTLALWQTATGQDAHSLNSNPGFTNAGGTAADDYLTSASLPGVTGTGIATDFNGLTRGSVPKMGALEANYFVWQGGLSTDFATAGNWVGSAVPTDGADITFAANPDRSCVLDQNRILKSITNAQATDNLNANGYQLTITGNLEFTNGAQIDASATSSTIEFAGVEAQSIPTGAFASNTVDGLTINNSLGVMLNGALTVTSALALTSGEFNLGANTLTLNGNITASAGSLFGGSSTNIIMGGSGASTNLPAITVNNLTLNRTNGIGLEGNVSIGGTLALTNGTLFLGPNSLTLSGSSPTRTTGNIDASHASATLVFANAAAITLPASIITGNVNNFTISGFGGVTASSDFTIAGILTLESANPSSTKGSLHLWDGSSHKTLTMGALATTTGIGDVTGIISRNYFTSGIRYTFGSEHTNISFIPGGTFPNNIQVKITIGAPPSWKPDAINRVYDFIQSGGVNCLATIATCYLESELNGNSENSLSDWTYGANGQQPAGAYDWGFTNSNLTENWIEIANVNIAYFPTVFGNLENTLSTSVAEYLVWNGSVDTNWDEPNNWTPVMVPGTLSYVVIPDSTTTPNDPILPMTATINNIWLHSGSVLNSATSSVLTLTGNVTWINAGGTFNPASGTVIYSNAESNISGTTSFYNIIIPDTTTVWLSLASYIKIAGALTNNGTLRTVISGETTVEYNGTGDQTVVVPNSSTNRYYNLILSGGGTKTMPVSALNITGDFSILETAGVTAAAAITINGNVTIGVDATFATGSFDHSVGGNFDNNGTFTASSNYKITLNGLLAQSIFGIATTFEKLTIDNASGVNLFTNILVNDALTLTSGTLSVGEATITMNGSLTKTAGFMDVMALTSLNFGGTAALTIPATLFATTPTINNITINRTGGVTFSSDLTVNGVLTLQSANPSSILGSLNMGSYTLDMGGSSTTLGLGDVTGIVRRTTVVPNVEYSFGNEFTTITFPNVGTLPTEISVKTYIGAAPSWKSIAINRIYDVTQTGGSGTQAVLKAHYLDSELNGNLESKIVDWSYRYSSSTLTEHGRANFNATDNWISISNVNIAFFPSGFGAVELTLSASELTSLTWNGSVTTSWVTTANWTPEGAPSDNTIVIIPDAATTPNDAILPVVATCGTITIENGGILNSASDAQFTLNGASGVWSNQGGTFNAGTSTIIFTNAAGVINGETDFNNITINSGASLTLSTGSVTRIAGTLTNNGIVNAGLFSNTFEYNGTDQTVLNINGITNPGYHNLILSGSGTKTMPSTPMNILGGFTTTGTTIATAAEVLTVAGNLTIDNGATFATGSFDHTVGGNFENIGSFTASSGKSITLNGLTPQTILGTSAISFENLTIDNAEGVTLSRDISVNGVLALTTGYIGIGSTTLSINGDISTLSGQMVVGSTSSLIFGGTEAETLPNNLFTATPSINNLTINRSGGVTLGNQNITIEGLLDLTSGTFNLSSYKLTLGGASPTRTTGNIDASNTGATLAFTNAAAIFLPASIFSGNVTNITIDGAGGVTSNGDITVTGEVNLLSANPSSTKGALDMGLNTFNIGESGHFIGIGDITGIVKREHTFNYNEEYDFGNEFTRLTFLGVPSTTKPTWVSCKIEIGTAPVWRGVAVKRVYSFAQSGGTDRAFLKLHYLDSELNAGEPDETIITFWNDSDGLATGSNTSVNGKTSYDDTENWVGLVGMAINVIAPETTFANQYGLGYTNVSVITWTGLGSASYSGDWSLPEHWSGGIPSAGDDVLIPAGLATTYPYRNLLPGFTSAVVKTIEIESGATFALNDFDLTIYGATHAWVNNGTFTSINDNVIFANGSTTNIATIEGTTNFENITVAANTYIQPATGSIIRISGELTADVTSILDFTTNANTVEYNGADQTVINPISVTPGYYNLILSGSGTKILSALNIKNDLSTAGTTTTNATGILEILGSLTIGNGTVFSAGNYGHTIEKNIGNNGTFTANGSTISLNGSTSQLINDGNAIIFYNLDIDNTAGVVMQQSTEVSHAISLTNGFINLNSNTLTILSNSATSISRTNGYILSEQPDNSGKLKWNIGNNIDTYTFPFGNASGTYIPFVFDHTAGDIGNVTVSTYPTATNNTPFPSSVTNVDRDAIDNSENVVDRFWQIDKDGPAGTATLTFSVSNLELGSSSDLVAQHWNTAESKWDSPLADQTNTSNSATVPNVTNFSPWTLSGSSAPLPVSLLSFTAVNNNNYAKLNWETASETNNYGFDVEKSQDLNQWSKVGFIAGAGNSSQIMKYFYNDLLTDDIAKETEVLYYRLKQIDFNGKKAYSDACSINLNLKNRGRNVDFKLFPNPASEYLNIDNNASEQQFKGELYDHNAVLVKKFAVQGSIQLDISDCNPGAYVIVITNSANGNKYRYTILKVTK